MLTLILVFCVLLISVLVLAAMRKFAGRAEEELLLHVGDPSLVEKNKSVVQRVDAIEKWGKTLTVITLAYGLIVVAYYLWVGWHQSGQIVQ